MDLIFGNSLFTAVYLLSQYVTKKGFVMFWMLIMVCFCFCSCRLASERIYAVFTNYTHDKVTSDVYSPKD